MVRYFFFWSNKLEKIQNVMVIPSVVKGWKKWICSDIASSPENQLGPTFPFVTTG